MKENLIEGIKKFFSCCFGLLILVGIITLGMKYQKSREDKFPWKGTFYRIDNDFTTLIDSGDFESLEKCRSWADERADHFGLNDNEFDYSCGTGCTYKDNEVVDGKKVNNYECSEITK